MKRTGDWPNAGASQFVSAAGLTWHVQKIGRGPEVLLVHGTGASTHSWRDVMPLLAEDHTVIAIDLPGHAFTTSTDRSQSLEAMSRGIVALLKSINSTPKIAVGHSAGAVILARMCAMNMIAPEKLISFNGAFYPVTGVAGALFPPLAKLMSNSITAHIFAKMASPASVTRLIRDTGSDLSPEGLVYYQRLFADPGHIRATLAMMAEWDLSGTDADLAHIKSHCIFVAAENDRTIPPATSTRASTRCRHATVLTIAKRGHLMHEEDPIEAARIIRA